MAPRRRPKVGSSRMDAALDAMRAMGFSTPVVRKCVKNLLKVYGNEGWVAIEEAAYTLLIDTLLEEPLVEQLEHEPQKPLLEGFSQSQANTDQQKQPKPQKLLLEGDSQSQATDHEKQPEPQKPLLEGGLQSQATDHEKQPEPVPQLTMSDKNVIVEDRKAITTRGDDIIKVKQEESEERVLEGSSHSQATDHEKQPEPVQRLIMSDKNVIVEDKRVAMTHGDDIIQVRQEEESEERVLGGSSQSQVTGHEKQPEPVQQLIMNKNVIVEDKTVTKTHGDDIIQVQQEEESEKQGSYINATPMVLQVDKAQLGFDLACTPESSDIINSKKRARKPCFGWISDDDDEDDEFLQLTPAKSVESCCMKKNN